MAAAAVIAPVWSRFLMTYPEVQLELELGLSRRSTSWRRDSMQASAPPEHAAADMVAVRVSGPMKLAVVGAPSYFARRPCRTPLGSWRTTAASTIATALTAASASGNSNAMASGCGSR